MDKAFITEFRINGIGMLPFRTTYSFSLNKMEATQEEDDSEDGLDWEIVDHEETEEDRKYDDLARKQVESWLKDANVEVTRVAYE